MNQLRIIKATYYDPDIGFEKGTDVTEQASAEIRDERFFYNGIYNNIFPDNFLNKRKKLRIEIEYKRKKFIKFYNENEKINLPNDLGKIENSLLFSKNWLIKNKKLITLVISIAVVILGGSKYIFNIKITDILNKNNISSLNQTGGITADSVVVYQQLSESDNLDISNLPSAFNFLDKTKRFNTSLEKENYIKTVLGTEVGDSGYVYDISGNGFSPNNYYVFIQKNKGNIFPTIFIMCMTNEKNVKLAILRKGSESIIKFKGQISGSSLDNCEFQ